MRRTTADTGHLWAAWGGGGEHILRYIRQPRYIAGLIYGPREPRYNEFPLYLPPNHKVQGSPCALNPLPDDKF